MNLNMRSPLSKSCQMTLKLFRHVFYIMYHKKCIFLFFNTPYCVYFQLSLFILFLQYPLFSKYSLYFPTVHTFCLILSLNIFPIFWFSYITIFLWPRLLLFPIFYIPYIPLSFLWLLWQDCWELKQDLFDFPCFFVGELGKGAKKKKKKCFLYHVP